MRAATSPSADWRVHCPAPLPGAWRDHLGAPGNVALTFDDGPDPVTTPIILDLLAAHEVRATFFVIGRKVVQQPQLLQRIVDEGHLVANHTYTHPLAPDDMDAIPLADRAREMDDATRAIQDSVGITPCFFRGPQGRHRSEETIALANERGMLVSGWTVSALDYLQPLVHDEATIEEMVQRTTSPPRERPVVLWHDSRDKPNTPPAVDRAITIFKEQGYGFVDPHGRQIPPVAEDLLGVCPARLRLVTGFTDLPTGSAHRHAVVCAADRGVISGRPDGTFAPQRSLTRGQFATMLDRMLGADGVRPGGGTHDLHLDDVSGSTHAEAIDRLAAAGVVRGRANGAFGPTEPVSRAQVAAMLERAAETGFGIVFPEEPDLPFTDVPASSSHARSIARLAEAGLVGGVEETRFAPHRPVTRAQAASMLMRLEAVRG